MNKIKDFILLIPCYNDINGLVKSIKSIEYPPDKFEVLIIDDGSSDPVSSNHLLNPEITINILRLDKNGGIVNALNTGLKYLKNRTDFKYIARLDAGDTCHNDRFKNQVTFLDQNPEISLLGTWCRFEDQITGKGYNYITKTKHEDILKEMHFKCSFIHPTVMFRKEVIDSIGLYPTTFPHAEDYAYFWEILKKYKGAIIDKILVFTKINHGISQANRKAQMLTRTKVIWQYGPNIFLKIISLIRIIIIMIIPNQFALKLKRIKPI